MIIYLIGVVAKTDVILNTENANTEGMRVNTEKHITGGQTSTNQNVSTDGVGYQH